MNYAMYHDNRISAKQTREVPGFFAGNTFRVILTIVTLVLLGLYVARLSTVSIKGYDISALQPQVKTLQEEDSQLQFEIAKNGSMQNIQDRLKSVQFVPAEKPDFASLIPPVVAVR